MAGLSVQSDTGQSPQGLSATAMTVIQASMAGKSKMAYLHAWKKLEKHWIEHSLNPKLPLRSTELVNYLSVLYDEGYAASTIASHSAAITFTHKLLGLSDPSDSFIVKKFLRGVTKLVGTNDSRLPITRSILVQLLNAIPCIITTQCYRQLLKAVFAVTFAGFFRIGELCLSSGFETSVLVQMSDVQFTFSGRQPIAVTISLHHYKHKKSSEPVHIYIPASGDSSPHCPVILLWQYLQMFKNTHGPLFQFLDRTPVKYSFIAEKLQILIRYIGLDPGRYKPHSFRIGAASSALMDGYSEDAIRNMGRWKSSAVKNYIRLPAVHL
ncbi:MAG: hypothetical protein ABW185_23265 [Sedimenticola sp.]